jgi:hypothetical protein
MSIQQITIAAFQAGLSERQAARQATAEADKDAKFPKGKPADPTANMTPEQKAEWEKQNKEHRDKFKAARANKTAGRITVRDLERILGNESPAGDLDALAKTLGRARGWRGAERAMEEADQVLKTFGIEAIYEEGEYGDPVALYLNTGDTYAATIVYDVENDELYVGDWGGFVEEFEQSGRQVRAADEDDKDAKFEKGEDVPLKDMPKKLQENVKNPPPSVQKLKEKLKSKKAYIDDGTLEQLVDMAMESAGSEGDVSGEAWEEVSDAAGEWNDAVSKALLRWVKGNQAKLNLKARPFRRVRTEQDIVDVLQQHRGGAGYLYFMEMEGHGVGTWDGDWDQLFVNGDRTVDELSKYMERAVASEYRDLQTAIENAAFSAESEEEDHRYASGTRQRLSWDPKTKARLAAHPLHTKEAARAPGGLYGYTKKVQADCEACTRKLGRRAASLARAAWNKDNRVAGFLQTHAKRGKSRSAALLVAAMKDIGPKVASDKTSAGSGASNATYLEGLDPRQKTAILKAVAGHYGVSTREIEAELKDRDAEALYEYLAFDNRMAMRVYRDFKSMRLASDKAPAPTGKEATSYGMYGQPSKVARLGLTACASLKEAAGELAADLHRRRAAKHSSYTGFLKDHSKTAKCGYSGMLLSYYPDSSAKYASVAPDSVDDWLAWDEG